MSGMEAENIRMPKFHVDINNHKNPTSSRPLINPRGTFVQTRCRFLNHFLIRIQTTCHCVVEGSQQIVQQLNLLYGKQDGLLGLVWDFVSLYPNLHVFGADPNVEDDKNLILCKQKRF